MSERIRRGRKWGSAAAAGIAVLVAAACSSPGSGQASSPSSSSSAGTSATVTKIAIALPAKITDYGWNQQGANAAKTVASASGAHLTVISNIGYNNTQSLLSQLARGHAQFIIAHASGFDTAAKQVALQYHVPIMTYDIPNELVPGLVSNITTSAQQGGYLAGIPRSQDDQDEDRRDRHFGQRHELVPDERRVRRRRAQRQPKGEDPVRRDRPRRLR